MGVSGFNGGKLTRRISVLDVVSIVANICLRKHRDEALERELLRQRHEIGWFNSYQHSVQRHSRASSGIGLMRR